jgi:hypothetical protein
VQEVDQFLADLDNRAPDLDDVRIDHQVNSPSQSRQ